MYVEESSRVPPSQKLPRLKERNARILKQQGVYCNTTPLHIKRWNQLPPCLYFVIHLFSQVSGGLSETPHNRSVAQKFDVQYMEYSTDTSVQYERTCAFHDCLKMEWWLFTLHVLLYCVHISFVEICVICIRTYIRVMVRVYLIYYYGLKILFFVLVVIDFTCICNVQCGQFLPQAPKAAISQFAFHDLIIPIPYSPVSLKGGPPESQEMLFRSDSIPK